MRYHVVEVVWGKRYTDLFLNTHLPSLLAAGNLPALSLKAECVYQIYTTLSNAETISRHRFFKDVNNLMRTEIITPDHIFRTNGHSVPISLLLMTRCHRMAVFDAAMRDAIMIFPQCDTVITNGAFERICEIASSGKRVVLTTALRFCKETLVPEMFRLFQNSDGYLDLSSRPIVDVALNHLHPLMKALFIDSETFSKSPANILWPINGEGLLARCLYLHPLMIYPRNRTALPIGAFDTEFLLNACPSFDDYHLVLDSDELAVLELSEENKRYESIIKNQFNIFDFANYIRHRGNKIHHRLLKEIIYFHSKDLSSRWKIIERNSNRIIRKALAIKTFMNIKSPATI